jgi:hypothetical protein
MRMWTDSNEALPKVSLEHKTKLPAIRKEYSCLRQLSDYWLFKEEFSNEITDFNILYVSVHRTNVTSLQSIKTEPYIVAVYLDSLFFHMYLSK